MLLRFLCSDLRFSFVRFTPGCFIYLDANENGIAFHFNYFYLLLVYRNVINFYLIFMTLYPATLIHLFISPRIVV